MPQDPFQGRAPSEGAPYDHALTITPSDTADLPVIPSAILIPPTRAIYADVSGNDTDTPTDDPSAVWNRFPYDLEAIASRTNAPNFVLVEMQDGSQVSLVAPSVFDLSKAAPYIIELRPRRILRTGTTIGTVTLLW